MAAFFSSGPGESRDPDADQEMMRALGGPQAVDQAVRSAISICWMMLPKDRRTVEAVEVEIRRLVDRALANFREDAEAFDINSRAIAPDHEPPQGTGTPPET